MRLVIIGLEYIPMYLDDVIALEDIPTDHVTTLAAFFARLRLYRL